MTPWEHHASLLALVRDQAATNLRAGATDWLRSVVERIDEVTPASRLSRATQPVVGQHLTSAIGLSTESTRSLALAIGEARHALAWRRAYEDVDGDAAFLHFRANYAYTRIVGPSADGMAPFLHPDLAVGFTLQAPNVHYGMHHHPAVEIYSIIGGTAEWGRNDEPWTPRPPGSVIVHESHDHHAMNTADEPTLTWWTWVTEVGSSQAVVMS